MDNLDNLFDVIKGGLTKDFDIGHVSHRKDGDWKKVAQGKWVPVKAAGGKKETGADTRSREDQIDMMQTVSEYFEEEVDTNPHVSDKPTLAKIYWALKEGKDTSSFNQHDVEGMKSWMGMDQEEEPKAEKKTSTSGLSEEEEKERKHIINVVREIAGEKNVDETKIRLKPDKNPKAWRVYYGDKYIGAQGNWTFPAEAAKKVGWLDEQKPAETNPGAPTFKMGQKVRIKKEFLNPGEKQTPYTIANINEGTGRAYIQEHESKYLPSQELVGLNMLEPVPENEGAETKPEPKTEGKRELKHRADGTPIYESPEDVIYDMVENYNELDRGDLQGVIEAAAMEHGWDENEILEEVDRQAAEKYDLNVDAAPRQLTADTKIRLSKIKRETCDARRTYRIGEISETTGLQKTANGWREVKKGGAGSAAPKAAPEKKVFEGKGAYKGHTWTATKEGDKYKLEWEDADGKITNSELTKAEFDEMKTNVPSEGKAGAPKPQASAKEKLPKYYEDLGDLVDEKRALRDKTKNRDEQRKLNGEIRELLQKMDTAPFGYEKSESYKRKHGKK